MVDDLRAAGKALLSLVAELDGEIVGHVLFSPMTVQSDGESYPVVCLAPLAVDPPHQNQGIGTQLMWTALAELRQAGHGAVVLMGHPAYYPRFGFRPAREFDLHFQDDGDYFMALELQPGALDGVSGRAVLAEEFDRFI